MFVVRHVLPVSEVAASALRATLDDVAGEGGVGQFVMILPGPAELMDQRCTDHCAVDHSAGDDDISAQSQRFDNARCTEIRIDGHAHRRQGRASEHFVNARAT